MKRILGLLATTMALGACDGGDPSGPDATDTSDTDVADDGRDTGADADADADGADGGSGFVPDEEPAGAALLISVSLDDPAAPVAQVWAKELGSILGLACRLSFDDGRLSAGAPVAETFLGPDSAMEAKYLAVARPGDVALGAVRRGSDAGEREISARTLVATIPLSALAPGESRLDLVDAQVRRLDGSFVPVAVAGGRLTAGGAP